MIPGIILAAGKSVRMGRTKALLPIAANETFLDRVTRTLREGGVDDVIVVVGAICFWAIDKFANDRRLANLLKLLVVLVCLGAIVQRLLVLTY